MMFVGMEGGRIDVGMEEVVYGIKIRFGNGSLVWVKKGCGKCVMGLMKVYEKEDGVCLD